MGYELDFLAVGNGESSGDAIAFRFGNLFGKRSEQGVVVVDGGYQESGAQMVAHVKKHFNTDTVDVVVSSHPDNDHSSGLSIVLDELKVGQLWMHRPWNHTDDIARMFTSGRVTDASVKETLRRSLESARDLETIAKRKGIPIVEPFTGVSAFGTALQVVGPTSTYYESLLPGFRCTPEAAPSASLAALRRFLEGVSDVVASVAEEWHIETLGDDGETSAENNSSTILLLRPETDHHILLTADAGIPALTQAADILDIVAFDYNTIKVIQVPHHGSRRNVGPTILDRLLGKKQGTDAKLRNAYVSASKDGAPKHPAKKVCNAFRRRGAYVYGTMHGYPIGYSKDAPARAGWSALDPLPFYSVVEDSEAA